MNTLFPLEASISTSGVWAWVVLPLLIFFARMLDVPVGTVRVILLARGNRVAVLLGFFESLIWIVVISQVMQNLGNPASYIAWAAGFSAGTYIGIWLENRLAVGMLLVRVIVPGHADELVEHLSAAGYGVTCVDARGAKGKVELVYTIIKRKSAKQVIATVEQITPAAFVSVEEVQSASRGTFPPVLVTHVALPTLIRKRQKRK